MKKLDNIKNWLLKIEIKRVNLNGQDVITVTEDAWNKLIELITEDE